MHSSAEFRLYIIQFVSVASFQTSRRKRLESHSNDESEMLSEIVDGFSSRRSSSQMMGNTNTELVNMHVAKRLQTGMVRPCRANIIGSLANIIVAQ
ncbi:hypothetical protein CEXT_191291 [Caerostris extrusa]|uniref:Uncharacterized protein n=1 Tax=Caerostris extrusa TaxID=172846 RepID=A0AAV4WLH7_CAEEX|nr:hypothetical protein CEXT_191291 [Caerostris extrusa]